MLEHAFRIWKAKRFLVALSTSLTSQLDQMVTPIVQTRSTSHIHVSKHDLHICPQWRPMKTWWLLLRMYHMLRQQWRVIVLLHIGTLQEFRTSLLANVMPSKGVLTFVVLPKLQRDPKALQLQ